MNKLQIYKASAGSGKTYLLTENYLKLAFENPENFSKILAVTFTNKAADEMKSRILYELNNFINAGRTSNHYDSISEHLKIENENELKNKAIKLRDNLLHNYSMFYVGTIDSFVQKVVRSFAYEMNLNSSYDIEMDNDKVINDLTEKLYDNISDNRELQNWLIKFTEYKINDGRSWDFRNEVTELTKEIFKEKFQSLKIKEADSDSEMMKIEEFKDSLYGIKKSFEEKMMKISIEYGNIVNKAGIDHSKLGRNFNTISNHFLKKIPDKNFDDIKVTLINALDGIENWYAKSAKEDVKTLIESVQPALLKCLENFFELFNKESQMYYTAEAVIKNFYSFGIINDIAGFLPEYRSENNILLISDTNLLLRHIIGNNDAPFIYEKFGNRFNNILIDEFQDTSRFQWDNFKPLIQNSLSQGYYDMIVGDIKQSIYRWRSGDWKLLHEQVNKDIGNLFAEEQTLAYNRRSRKNIVDFNNFIFDMLPDLLQKQYNSDLSEIINAEVKEKLYSEGFDKIIKAAYEKQSQKIPESRKNEGGLVKLYFAEKSTTDSNNEKLENILPETIDNMLKSGDIKAADIGILVRKNAEAKCIADMLMKYKQENKGAAEYQIISPESLYINNSVSVKIIICCLKFLQSADNEINTAQLVYLYQHYINNDTIEMNRIFMTVKDGSFKGFLPENFISSIDELMYKSIYELSEEIIKLFDLNLKKNDFPFIKAFQNIIIDQINKQRSNLTDFIDWWDDKGKEKSVQLSTETDALQIMTIHGSKGLAFKFVFIPYADLNIDHLGNNAPLMWVNSGKKPFSNYQYLPVKYSPKLSQTYFAADYFNEKLYAHIDAVNLLYVAFTRAKDELHIFSQYSSKFKSTYKSAGQMIYDSIADLAVQQKISKFKEYTYNEFLIYELSENHSIFPESKKETDIKTLLYQPDSYPNSNIEDKIKINFSSEEFFIESIDEREHKVNYGILMHQIFSEIKYADEVDIALNKMILEGYVSENEKNELKKEITEIISRPGVADWFSKKYKVINEEALITSHGEIRIPDRVLINDEKLIVVDFKFGKKHKKYSKQISEYKQILNEVYNKETEAFIYYIENDVIENV